MNDIEQYENEQIIHEYQDWAEFSMWCYSTISRRSGEEFVLDSTTIILHWYLESTIKRKKPSFKEKTKNEQFKFNLTIIILSEKTGDIEFNSRMLDEKSKRNLFIEENVGLQQTVVCNSRALY